MIWLARLHTYFRLGPANLLRVAAYRLGLRTGTHPVCHIKTSMAASHFFRASERTADIPVANENWRDELIWFGWYRQPASVNPPCWLDNPFSSLPQPDTSHDWWRISDFEAGDIKGLWELSRFDWVVAWSTQIANGDTESLKRLNSWLADWTDKNPPYKGPNWKCGQEAAFRVIHLVTASWILGLDRTPDLGLVELIRMHILRIAPTLSYAIAQQNNHGTSEAAAMFMGGEFLSGHDARASIWAEKGRRLLENRVTQLIEVDGSFSQYSVNYHRVLLDTCAVAEAWRRHRGLPAFSAQYAERMSRATSWMWALVEPSTGDAPNIGANDGARLLPLTTSDYRDFRPTVQLASTLFCGASAYSSGEWNDQLRWLNVPSALPGPAPVSQSFDKGGYHLLKQPGVFAVMRYPRFQFRPSQADALHLDLWVGAINLLRDAGTFSYNSAESDWFSGTASHNTIEFDGQDQMPRLGRFLYGDWLKTTNVDLVQSGEGCETASATYVHRSGITHRRVVTLTSEMLTCVDEVSGKFSQAVLRWRLAPLEWAVEDHRVLADKYSITITKDHQPATPVLGTTVESRYYHSKTSTPQIFLEIESPTTLVTKVSF